MNEDKIIESVYINDYRWITRTWSERLFTRPWRPWVKHKQIYSPMAYVMKDGSIFVSPRTAKRMNTNERTHK